MRKYTRMVCWVTAETKNEILKIAGDLPIVFADNYKDFRNTISNDSYLAAGLSVAYNNLDNFKLLLRDFSNKIRLICDDQSEWSQCFQDVGEEYNQVIKKIDVFTTPLLVKDFQKRTGDND